MADDKEKRRKPKPEPEPEGGPEGRREEFITERLTPLRPRGPEDEEEGLATRSIEEAQTELPADFRATRVAAYRKRQKKQLKEQEEEGGARPRARRSRRARESGEEDADGEPPQAPAPPPANNCRARAAPCPR